MYMEAYSSVGNWADSILKRSIEAGFTRKMAKEDVKEALPKQGVSPTGEGGSEQATPQANEVQPQANDINQEMMAKDKAIKSLEKKVANWHAKAQYQKSLATMYQKQLLKNKRVEVVGGAK